MKQRPRRYFTQTEMSEVWDRWEKGDSLNAIAHQRAPGAAPRIRELTGRLSGLAGGVRTCNINTIPYNPWNQGRG